MRAVDRFSRDAIAAEQSPGNGYIPGSLSRHNRKGGSTKKIDGRDFIASYHSNTGGKREMAERVAAAKDEPTNERKGGRKEGSKIARALSRSSRGQRRSQAGREGAFAPFNRP